MNDRRNSVPLVVLVCILFFLGIICVGFGIGKLLNREWEGALIAAGLGLIAVGTLLAKNFIRDES
jgi:cytochrome c biogenesis protein CcdA